MGKLRKEPKVKPFLSEKEYENYLDLLQEAQVAANDNHIYYDLEDGESGNRVRKALLYVAEKEGIEVAVARKRGEETLRLDFRSGDKAGGGSRISAEESRRRILQVLGEASEPLAKSDIISKAKISSSTWNIRVKELLAQGSVVRDGDRRDTRYTLK